MTSLLLTLMKPIFLLAGVESQIILVIFIRQLLALKHISTYLENKSRILYCILFYTSINLFFLRTGHRYQFDKLQYTEIFLGFSEYSPILHSIFLAINTFSSLLLAMFALPYCSNTTKAHKALPITRSSIVLNQPT
jgi:hypothetical protein